LCYPSLRRIFGTPPSLHHPARTFFSTLAVISPSSKKIERDSLAFLSEFASRARMFSFFPPFASLPVDPVFGPPSVFMGFEFFCAEVYEGYVGDAPFPWFSPRCYTDSFTENVSMVGSARPSSGAHAGGGAAARRLSKELIPLIFSRSRSRFWKWREVLPHAH